MNCSVTTETTRPIAVTVRRAAEITSLSAASIRLLARTGKLRVARIGRRIVIPVSAIEQLLREASR